MMFECFHQLTTILSMVRRIPYFIIPLSPMRFQLYKLFDDAFRVRHMLTNPSLSTIILTMLYAIYL